jgi:hypothetical protein
MSSPATQQPQFWGGNWGPVALLMYSVYTGLVSWGDVLHSIKSISNGALQKIIFHIQV